MLAYILSTTLYRRKKIGLLATQRWGESLPKFKSPDTKQQLTEFATRITPECGIPELNSNADGIARHIQNFFTEQRRYRKIKTTSCKVCFLLASDFDKGSLMCVLGNFLLMLLFNSFLIVLCFYYCYKIFISIESKHTSYIIFFHFKHFQSDHIPKEEKSWKKHKDKQVGITNSLMLYFGYKYNRSVVTCIPT